jgi:uncharacterized protein YdeI (YjbR/CyaY-like superfamily)
MIPVKVTFFATPAKWRAWLERHHESALELWVGFHKRGSGKPSITWPESVDGALCFGWIDGVRKRVDATSYTIRFTPRRARSIWSAVNTKRFAELEQLGLVHAAGHAAFAKRHHDRAGIYSYEQKQHTLGAAFERRFKANRKAWEFYRSMAPWYRRTTAHWVTSAKQEATRERRLASLIDDCAHGRTIALLQRKKP